MVPLELFVDAKTEGVADWASSELSMKIRVRITTEDAQRSIEDRVLFYFTPGRLECRRSRGGELLRERCAPALWVSILSVYSMMERSSNSFEAMTATVGSGLCVSYSEG